MKKVLLGFELISGNKVEIDSEHMVVTGVSQQSGKTTTLESLIKRSEKKAIVFRTKIGEKSFLEGTIIPPFFRDRSDWKFIKSIIESTMKIRIDKFEQATIIQLCKETGGNSLLDFKKKVDQKLGEKISQVARTILTNLQAYLDEVVPKLQTITFSNTLNLVEGLNIIDLERFSRDSQVQGLIISSVLDEVLYNYKDVIVLIPEAWKFIPQDRGSPCKLALEEFIRQGATNNNFIWIDSQDMSGVDKTPLKQISVWCLGYQAEINEVKHTLDQIPLPPSQKPKANDIMTLGKGIFYLCTREKTIKTYVLPFWLDEEKGIKIAKGEMNISEIDAPKSLAPYKIAPITLKESESSVDKEAFKEVAKDINEVRQDFFDKVQILQSQIIEIKTRLYEMENSKPEINKDDLVSYVLQKLPVGNPSSAPNFDKNALINEILARVPKGGNVTYEVAPLEKITKDFLEEAKNRILGMITALPDDMKRSLKFAEAKKPTSKSEIYTIGLGNSGGYAGGGTFDKGINSMVAQGLMSKDSKSGFRGNLKERIKAECEATGITDDEVNQVYNHILMEMLK